MPPRIFIPAAPSGNETVTLEGEDARYLAVVLRAEKGDEVVLVCPDGSRQLSQVIAVTQKSVELRPVGETVPARNEMDARIVLVQGMLKGQKMDLVIQKSTELGVSAIVPVECERTVLRETRKHERWTKIALEASRQCGRPMPPLLHEPQGFVNYLKGLGDARGVIFYEAPDMRELDAADVKGISAGGDMLIVVGPEGGFAKAEVEAATRAGLVVRGLGPNILRAETASIAAVAITGYLLRG